MATFQKLNLKLRNIATYLIREFKIAVIKKLSHDAVHQNLTQHCKLTIP